MTDKIKAALVTVAALAGIVLTSWLVYKNMYVIEVGSCISYIGEENDYFKTVVHKVVQMEEEKYYRTKIVSFAEPKQIDQLIMLLTFNRMVIPAKFIEDFDKTQCPAKERNIVKETQEANNG